MPAQRIRGRSTVARQIAPRSTTERPLIPQTARGWTTRTALLEAARRVFTRDGFESTRITDITEEAGLAAGSFYNYFVAKEDIFREVACEVIDELTAAPRRDPSNRSADPARDLEFAIRQYISACTRHGRLTASIQQVSHADPELRAYRQQKVAENAARGARYIRRLQQAGVAAAEVDAATVAPALQTMVINTVYENLVLFETGVDTERLARTLSQLWLRAIGVKLPPPRAARR